MSMTDEKRFFSVVTVFTLAFGILGMQARGPHLMS